MIYVMTDLLSERQDSTGLNNGHLLLIPQVLFKEENTNVVVHIYSDIQCVIIT